MAWRSNCLGWDVVPIWPKSHDILQVRAPRTAHEAWERLRLPELQACPVYEQSYKDYKRLAINWKLEELVLLLKELRVSHTKASFQTFTPRSNACKVDELLGRTLMCLPGRSGNLQKLVWQLNTTHNPKNKLGASTPKKVTGSLRERRSSAMVRQDVEFEDDDCAELLKIYTRGQRLGCGSQGQVFVLKGATSYAGKMFRAGRDAGRELRLMSKLRGCAGVVSLAGFVKERSGGACYGTMLGAAAVHEVVIGDFGVATDDPKEMSQCCGTGKYMAPEVTSCKGDARSQSFYTAAIDVWALGVIAYELLRGYKQSREIELLRAGEFPDGCPLSDEAEDLICGMLAVEPSERLTLDGVLEHPWIVENCSSKTIQKRRRCGVKRSAPGFSSDLVVKKVRAA
ncbi:hypothetical protein SELMODRAFT_404155 [Selaginella moellendorffii]|uniref:Protein kinase domain-containing protein n=1 Tax=Selaginella moellendorffii TaxID=88036 RepID=D8QUF9_SELML|nr:hypothetical protein SELMODRAFT_404155 [Selaginella moellendorffii]